MHSTSSVAPLHISYHLKPIQFQPCRLHLHLHQTRTRTRTSKINCQPSITETYVPNYSFYCRKQVQESSSSSSSSPLSSNKNQNNGFLKKPNSPIDNTPNKGHRRATNMWWTDLKAALGQRINVEGLLCSVSVISRDKQLALPHISVRDIRYIDWVALKQEGFQGVVFDKDNTLTAPYSLNLWGPLAPSIESCKSVFGNNIAVFSNSAGLYEYDPDDRKARALEFMIGIKVIRHRVKKPSGTAEEVERHFGCESSRLIMVGDRPFTDIVFGNRNGFLTILTEPLSLTEEPFIVKQVRKIELALVNRWSRRGFKPSTHRLQSDGWQYVKDLPPLVDVKSIVERSVGNIVTP